MEVFNINNNITTYHEAAVPGLDLLFGEVCVLHQEVHVFLRQLLAAAGTHRGCCTSASHGHLAGHVTCQLIFTSRD